MQPTIVASDFLLFDFCVFAFTITIYFVILYRIVGSAFGLGATFAALLTTLHSSSFE